MHHKETIGHSSYSNLDLTLSRSSKVKCHNAKRKPIYKLPLAFNSYWGSIVHHKGIIGHLSYSDLDLTFQGHPRSKVTVPKESPYMNC